ncbi:hypothetical protein T492DRAFT_969533, partial [Pavlovales sp. CCMP2436]
NSTGATGDRLKEGAAINQSLSNLGLVISALAERANFPKKKVLVPYRASKLTMLLQNALGGNSKTIMVAALSPADINYEETLGTLRYADRAKQIKTVATVQEDPTDRLIRELRAENSRLQTLVQSGGVTPRGGPQDAQGVELVTPEEMRAESQLYAVVEAVRRMKAVDDVKSAREQLQANERKIEALQMSWEEQLEQTRLVDVERTEAMRKLGFVELTPEQMKTTPSLVNLSDDPLMSGQLYFWMTKDVSAMGATEDADIVLQGLGVAPEHAKLEKSPDGSLLLCPLKGTTFINGKEIKGPTKLEHNARLIIGNTNVLRFNDPLAAAAARAAGATPKTLFDWDFAQKELSDALGATVTLKVEEEIAKEREALEVKATEMSTRFAKEREEMLAEVQRLRVQGPASAEAKAEEEFKLKEIESKIVQVAAFRKQREASIATYRRDLIRLEETLVRLNPVVGEANAMATQMGRKVAFAIKLETSIPETSTTSPLEELWNDKITDVMIRVTMTGHTDEVKRAWLWAVDEFYDRVFQIRDQFTLHLRSQPLGFSKNKTGDPFWAPPKPELIGKAFLYLTPIAHRSQFSDWLPILDIAGCTQGELKVSLKCTASNYVDAPEPVAEPESMLGEELHFTLRIDGARKLIGDVTTDTFVCYTFSDEERARMSDICEGRTTAPSYSYKEAFDVQKLSTKMLAYFTLDAICFEVWGQAEEVAEGIAKAAAIEQPPEIFDFFVSIDIHEATTEVRGDTWIEAGWEKGVTRDGKPALYVTQNRARRIVISVSQQQSLFMVSRFAHVWLGNLRDEFHHVWDASYIPLTITSQSRVGDRFELVCEWFSQFDALNQASCRGKVFYLDVKLECAELERLVLEEPVILNRRLNVAIEGKTNGAPGGLYSKKGPRRVVHEASGKGIVPDKDRIQRLEEHMQHYMGSWDITGEAVDIAMASLKSSAVADTGKEIKKQLHEMDEGLHKLAANMLDEQNRQLEVLAKALAKADGNAAAAIVEKKRQATERHAVVASAMQETRLEDESKVAAEAEIERLRKEALEEERRKLQQEQLKSKGLEEERKKLQDMLEEAQRQLEQSQKEAAAAKYKAGTQKKSSACLMQ